MALLFTRASNDFVTPPLVGWGAKLFISAKIRLASLPADGESFVIEDVEVGSGGLVNRRFYIVNTSGTYYLAFAWTAGIFLGVYSSPITISVGEWHQVSFYADADPSPDTVLMWFDETALTLSLNLPFMADEMPGYLSIASVGEIGGRYGFSEYFDGDIAELIVNFSFWSEEEVVALSRGVSPLAFYAVKKAGWGYYYSFKGGSLVDPTDSSPGAATATGTTPSKHPPVLYPRAMTGDFHRTIVPGVKFIINGVDLTYEVERTPTSKLTLKQGERSSGSLTLSTNAALPARYDDIKVIARDGYTRLFGGLIDQVTTRGIEANSAFFWKDLRLVDYSIYLDWALFTKTYIAPYTLQQLLIDMENQTLGPDYGIAIDSLQDTGDTFPASVEQPSVFSDFCGSILRTVMGQCNPPRISRMSPYKRLRVYIPGTLGSTPAIMSDAQPHCLSFEWTTPNLPTANYISLLCGGSGQETYNQVWQGDGVTASQEVDVPAVPGVPSYYVVDRFDGAVHHYETVSEPGNIGEWWWDTVLGRGTVYRNPGSLDPPPAVTDTLTFTYLAQFPYEVIATSGATPKIAYRTSTDEKDRAKNQLTANGLLAKLNQTIRNGTMITLEAEKFIPGQVMPGATVTNRNVVNRDFTMADVNMEFVDYMDPFLPRNLPITAKRFWLSMVAMTETTVYQGSYLDQARALFGSSSSGTPVGSGSSTPSNPLVVKEENLFFSDITTADATTAKHGLLPKLSGNAGDVLDGLGAFVPASGGSGGSGIIQIMTPAEEPDAPMVIPGAKGDKGDPGASGVQMLLMLTEPDGDAPAFFPPSAVTGATGPAFATDGDIAGFDGASGQRLKDLGTLSTLLDGLTI